MQRTGLQRSSTALTAFFLTATLCGFAGSSAANTGKEEHIIREVIAVGEIESPSELVGLPYYYDSSEKSADDLTFKHSEPIAHVTREPNSKSRTVARLTNGHPVKVLKIQKDWLKISWKTDEVQNQGWLKKTFVEKNTIHAHR